MIKIKIFNHSLIKTGNSKNRNEELKHHIRKYSNISNLCKKYPKYSKPAVPQAQHSESTYKSISDKCA